MRAKLRLLLRDQTMTTQLSSKENLLWCVAMGTACNKSLCMCMCACVCTCVRACMQTCVCLRVCMRACLRVYACAVHALLLAVKYLTSGNAWHIFEKLPYGLHFRPVIKFE